MTDTERYPDAVRQGAARLLRHLPVGTILGTLDAWRRINRLMADRWAGRLYEVEDYEVELRFRDRAGRLATIRQRETILPTQENMKAIQDLLWGDGDVIHTYASSAGEPVHDLERGEKQHVLVWLRQPLRRKQPSVVVSHQTLVGAFTKEQEWHEVLVRHRSRRIAFRAIFPRQRMPTWCAVRRSSRQGRYAPLDHQFRRLPDGRWVLSWECHNPGVGTIIRADWHW